MLQGLMMRTPLLISSLITHADRHHGDAEIVSRRVEGDVHRTTYRELHRRSRQLANALDGLGLRSGDRVATLAWNGYRHMELYFAVSGSGSVLHTINPRLHPEQIAWIVNHAEDRAMFFDLTFLPLIEAIAPHCRTVQHWVAMTDRAHMPVSSKVDGLQCYEEVLSSHSDRFAWPEFDENSASSMMLHVGHNRAPEGRALQPSLNGAAHAGRGLAGRPKRLGPRRDPPGGADVPRQCLGTAIRGADGRLQRWSSRDRISTASRCTTCSSQNA